MKKRKKGPPLNEIRNKNRNHDKSKTSREVDICSEFCAGGQRGCAHVRFTYNEGENVIMTVTGSASQMRGSGYLPRQAVVSWVQTNRSEQEFSVLKNL